MNSALLSIKIDPRIKKQAQKTAKELGFNVSGLVNAYLRHFVKTKTVYFSANKEEPSDYLVGMIEESRREVERGEISPAFSDAKKAIEWLNK